MAGHDWLDYADKLALPAVLALVGTLYSCHKDAADEQRAAWERDSGYVKLLASANDRERDLGIRIIDVLSREHRFSPELVPVVAAVAAGRPSDPATQAAQRILGANQAVVTQAQAQAPTPPTPAPALPTRAAATRVYVQIAREDQRDVASTLEADLRGAGFATPGIELVSNPTTNSYVRYFTRDSGGVAGARTIVALLARHGIAASVQDFSAGATGSRPIEVWIGKAQGAPAAAPVDG